MRRFGLLHKTLTPTRANVSRGKTSAIRCHVRGHGFPRTMRRTYLRRSKDVRCSGPRRRPRRLTCSSTVRFRNGSLPCSRFTSFPLHTEQVHTVPCTRLVALASSRGRIAPRSAVNRESATKSYALESPRRIPSAMERFLPHVLSCQAISCTRLLPDAPRLIPASRHELFRGFRFRSVLRGPTSCNSHVASRFLGSVLTSLVMGGPHLPRIVIAPHAA